jgi:hypothetical protein
MALTRIKEMVDSMNARPDAKDGFTSRDFYDTGAQFGVTCREVLFNFLGKSRAVGHNRYLAVLPETIVSSAKKRAEKKPAQKKVVKAQKSKPVKKQPVEKTTKVPKAIIDSADDSTGVVENTADAYVYIASPEEIASSEPLHTVDY